MIRFVAFGPRNALSAGSDGGARHRMVVTSLIATVKLTGIEPQARLTDSLERAVFGQTKANEFARLPPWAKPAERARGRCPWPDVAAVMRHTQRWFRGGRSRAAAVRPAPAADGRCRP